MFYSFRKIWFRVLNHPNSNKDWQRKMCDLKNVLTHCKVVMSRLIFCPRKPDRNFFRLLMQIGLTFGLIANKSFKTFSNIFFGRKIDWKSSSLKMLFSMRRHFLLFNYYKKKKNWPTIRKRSFPPNNINNDKILDRKRTIFYSFIMRGKKIRLKCRPCLIPPNSLSFSFSLFLFLPKHIERAVAFKKEFF